jgi:hypothetical protein
MSTPTNDTAINNLSGFIGSSSTQVQILIIGGIIVIGLIIVIILRNKRRK